MTKGERRKRRQKSRRKRRSKEQLKDIIKIKGNDLYKFKILKNWNLFRKKSKPSIFINGNQIEEYDIAIFDNNKTLKYLSIGEKIKVNNKNHGIIILIGYIHYSSRSRLG
jgi:hypothetical protein